MKIFIRILTTAILAIALPTLVSAAGHIQSRHVEKASFLRGVYPIHDSIPVELSGHRVPVWRQASNCDEAWEIMTARYYRETTFSSDLFANYSSSDLSSDNKAADSATHVEVSDDPIPSQKARRAETGSEVLVRIGQRVITRAELERELKRRSGNRPGQYASAEEVQSLLQSLIRYELQIEAARRSGLQEAPEMVAAVDRLLAGRFLQQQLESKLSNLQITDEELASYYEDQAAELTRPKRVLGAWLSIKRPQDASEKARSKALAKAEKAQAAARALPPEVRGFGDLARRFSDDRSTRYTGGSLGWISAGQRTHWPAAVVAALFELETPGALSPVIEGDSAIYLVRLIERQESHLPPLAEVATVLRHQLLRHRQREVTETFYRQLTADIGVQIDEALLAEIAPPTMPRPPEVPGSSEPQDEVNP